MAGRGLRLGAHVLLLVGLALGLALGFGALPVAPDAAPPVDASPVAAPDAAPSPVATDVAVPIPTQASPDPTPEPPAPAAPAPPRLPPDVSIGGVPVGGLTPAEARQRLMGALLPLWQPLTITLEERRYVLLPAEIGLEAPLDALVAAALTAAPGAAAPLLVEYDRAWLRVLLVELAAPLLTPAAEVSVGRGVAARSFVAAEGRWLDFDAALEEIDLRLRTPTAGREVLLRLGPPPPEVRRPDPAALREQVRALTATWPGRAGVAVYDLPSGALLAGVNEETVFSAASTMKVAVMLHAYLSLPALSADQRSWLHDMIVWSDNDAANALLAATAGGESLVDAMEGAQAMSDRLAALGLAYTYQYLPYNAWQALVDSGATIREGPVVEGPPPHTASDTALRTTPAEMARLYRWLWQCAGGAGPLLDRYAHLLAAAHCREMLALLADNADDTRLAAGLPPGARVAHKSGWVDDVHADAGIISTPGGDLAVAVYLHDPTSVDGEAAALLMAQIAHLVATYAAPLAP